MNRRLAQLFTLSLVFLIAGAMSVSAQVPTGSIVGTVVDAQGAAVQGAEVTITSKTTNTAFTAHTEPNGGYEVASLTYGLYRVEVKKDGFKTTTVEDVKLDASTQLSVPPIVMQVGAVTETVTVEAGGAEQVQTTSSEVTQVIDTAQLNDLPILDRSPLGMISMEPGVDSNNKTGTVIDGQRASFTSLTLDGINIQDNFIRTNDTNFSPNQLFLSQTGEFSINTQNGDPSVGGGSSAISIVTPRGTNNWHGEGFWYYRSNKWAANDWFNDAEGVPQVGLNQNQGGGNIGGPLLKNKLFIYGYYEFLSLGATQSQNTTILTAPAASGTFQYHTDCDNKPAPNGIPCPAGVVPGQLISVDLLTLENSARSGGSPIFTIDPVTAALIHQIPTTVGNNTRVGDTLNTTGFAFNARSNNKLRNPGIRVDYLASEHNSFSGTYAWNQQIVDRPDIDTSFDTVPIVTNNDKVNFATAAWRWSPNSLLTNEVRFGLNFAPATFATTQQFGSTFITGTDFTNPLPNFFGQGRNTRTYSYQDNGSWLKGNHSLVFGFQLQRVTIVPFNFGGTSEDLALGFSAGDSFALKTSDFPAPISANVLGNANGLLSTLGGFVGTTNETFNVTSPTSGFVPGASDTRNYAQNDWSVYAGDSWRLRKNLTVTYGLRWEYLAPFSEKNGLILLPVVPAGQTVTQTLLSNATINLASGNTGRLPYNRDLRDFAPNVGVAWDPWGNGKTAIRAGYSVHYVNDDLATAVNNASVGNAGLTSTNGNQNVSATLSGDNGLPIPPGVTAPAFGIPTTFQANFNALGGPGNNAGFAIDPNLKTPYVQDWNLSVQREIGEKTTVTVSYEGNHGTRLIRGIDVNQVIINQNGFLADFNRARSNCFLSLAATNPPVCNPNFNGPGGQPLTIFPTLPGGGFLNNGTVQADIETGQVGSLADLYHINGIESAPGQFTPNEFIRGGDLLENFSSSTWNAGLVQVRRRISHGLILQASYVFSKALDDNDGSQTNFTPLLDNANPQIEKARASFDLTHAFKANIAYELPFGKGQRWTPSNAIVNELVAGWHVSSIFTWQSGNPFSFFTGAAGSSGRGTVNRSGRSGNETVDTSLSQSQINSQLGLSFPTTGPFAGEVLLVNPSFIDPNSGLGAGPDGLTCAPLVANGFCNPQPGQLGTLSRNEFTGPMFFNWDFALYKRIPIRESMSLELRGEAFNFLNHPSFFAGDQNINSTSFGQATSTASTPRIVQIGATFRF